MIMITIICVKPIVFLLVDEEDEYECVSVVNSHTQDVKHVVWHPTQEVWYSFYMHVVQRSHYWLHTRNDQLFLVIFFCSFSHQPVMTTKCVFIKRWMMTGNVEPHWRVTNPLFGVWPLTLMDRDWCRVAMIVLWRSGRRRLEMVRAWGFQNVFYVQFCSIFLFWIVSL